MEHQNQQPIQEKMESKPNPKTNWKFVGIVVVSVLLAVGGILLLREQSAQQVLRGEVVGFDIESLARDGDGNLRLRMSDTKEITAIIPGVWSYSADLAECLEKGATGTVGKLRIGDRVEIKGKRHNNSIVVCEIKILEHSSR